MSLQIISRPRRVRLFLREYYLGHGPLRNTSRLLGGPLLVLFGACQLIGNSATSAVGAYGWFLILFGLYFLFRPLLLIARQPAAFQASTFEITLSDTGLRWQKNGQQSGVEFAACRSIRRRPDCYLLEIGTTGTVYLLADQLTATERQRLDAELTA